MHKKEQPKKNSRPKISIMTQHWNTGTDSLNLYMYMDLPLNHFVFKKNIDHFFSEVTFTLIISDKEQNTQIYRESWKEGITKPYYEDTRDPDNYFKTEKNIFLLSGEYNLFLNVQDADSRKNWKIVKEIELERVNYLSPALLFIKDKYGEINQVQFIMEKIDTLWLRTQVNLPEAKPDTPPDTDVIIPAQNKDYNGKYIAILDLDPIGVNEIELIDNTKLESGISLCDLLTKINLSLQNTLQNTELVIGHTIFYNEKVKIGEKYEWSNEMFEEFMCTRWERRSLHTIGMLTNPHGIATTTNILSILYDIVSWKQTPM